MESITPNKRSPIISLVLAFCLLTGCSGIKTYQNTRTHNLQIITQTDTGSHFSKVRTAVDIYRVDAGCHIEYEGTVELKNQSVKVGIPSDRLSYLVFVFAYSGFLSSSSGTISYEALLKPRSGYNYEAKVTYQGNMYNVVMHETHIRTKKRREIELKDLKSCSPSNSE